MGGGGRARRDLLVATALVPATLLALACLTGFFEAPLGVPLTYRGDELYQLGWVQGLLETGGWGFNPRLGAPAGQVQLDFPAPGLALAHVLLLKLLGLFSADPFVVVNAFLALTFPLVALAAYGFLRMAGLEPRVAAAGGLLYAFSPYHLLRGAEHLLHSGYHSIPALAAACLWLQRGARDPAPRGRRRALLGMALLLMGTTGGYYAFFSLWFLAAAALVGAVRHRSWRVAGWGLALVLGVLGLVAAQMIPTWSYVVHHGPNPEAMFRVHAETETLALKPATLVLPTPGHRLPAFSLLQQRYARAPLSNENQIAALGLLGACGAVTLLSWCLLGPLRTVAPRAGAPALLDELAPLFLAGLALGTVGGVGSLVGLLVSPAFRALNRVSVVLGLLALAASLRLLQMYLERVPRAGSWVLALVTGLALLDQVPAAALTRSPVTTNLFRSNARELPPLEASLPAGARVLQLPHVVFHAGTGVHDLRANEPLFAYLHTKRWRLSAGAVRGRPAASRLQALAARPMDELAFLARAEGFEAVLVDRAGFPGSAFEELGALERAVGLPATARDRWVLQPLGASPPAPACATPALIPGSWSVPMPVVPGETRYVDLAGAGSLLFHLAHARAGATRVTFSGRLEAAGPEAVAVRLTAAGRVRELRAGPAGAPVAFSVELALAPGLHDVRFDGVAPAVVQRADPTLRLASLALSGLALREDRNPCWSPEGNPAPPGG